MIKTTGIARRWIVVGVLAMLTVACGSGPQRLPVDLSGPVQLHHGTADASVPLEFSEILNQQVLAVGKTVELYTYEGADHNIASGFGLAMQLGMTHFDLSSSYSL